MSNEYIVKGAKSVQIKNDFGMSYFSLFKGGKLKNVNIAYETWGKLSINKDNAILVFTGLSPSSHAASSSENPAIWVASIQALILSAFLICFLMFSGNFVGRPKRRLIAELNRFSKD